MRGKGVDGKDGIGIHISDDGHICGEYQGLDALAKHEDAGTLADDRRYAQGSRTESALIGDRVMLDLDRLRRREVVFLYRDLVHWVASISTEIWLPLLSFHSVPMENG